MPKKKAAPGPSTRKTQTRTAKAKKQGTPSENTYGELPTFPPIHGRDNSHFSAPPVPQHTPNRADYLKHFHMTGQEYTSDLFPKAPKQPPKEKKPVDPDEKLKKRYLKMSNVERVRTTTELDREYTKLQKENGYRDQNLNKRFKKLGGISKKKPKKKQNAEKAGKSEETLRSEYEKLFGRQARDLSAYR